MSQPDVVPVTTRTFSPELFWRVPRASHLFLLSRTQTVPRLHKLLVSLFTSTHKLNGDVQFLLNDLKPW
jgi:hypothetical protein